jgi:hypothetical protein
LGNQPPPLYTSLITNKEEAVNDFMPAETPQTGPVILTLTLTEKDVRQIIDDGNLGNALGETPMSAHVSIGTIREYADQIIVELRDHLYETVSLLTDQYARVRPYPTEE